MSLKFFSLTYSLLFFNKLLCSTDFWALFIDDIYLIPWLRFSSFNDWRPALDDRIPKIPSKHSCILVSSISLSLSSYKAQDKEFPVSISVWICYIRSWSALNFSSRSFTHFSNLLKLTISYLTDLKTASVGFSLIFSIALFLRISLDLS